MGWQSTGARTSGALYILPSDELRANGRMSSTAFVEEADVPVASHCPGQHRIAEPAADTRDLGTDARCPALRRIARGKRIAEGRGHPQWPRKHRRAGQKHPQGECLRVD